jgi:hypothetical protein
MSEIKEVHYQDFDAFFAELNRKPLRFKVRGETFELPPEIPAAVVKHVIDLQRAGESAIPDEVVLDLGKYVLGEEVLNRLVYDLRLDMFEVGKIIDWAWLTYMGNGAAALGKQVAEAHQRKNGKKKRRGKR